MSRVILKRTRRGTKTGLVRFGFTLAEVLVAVAIMAVIASVFVPSLIKYMDINRVVSAKAEIDSLIVGVAEFKTAIGKYPSALNMLTDSIRTSGGGNTLNTLNSCTNTTNNLRYFTAAELASWRTLGPFFTKPIATNGYPIGIGTFNNPLTRTPFTVNTNSAGLLFFTAPDVRIEDIEELELLYDPSASSQDGVIRYGASVDGYADLTYVMRVRGC